MRDSVNACRESSKRSPLTNPVITTTLQRLTSGHGKGRRQQARKDLL